ncbi:MAG: hypothetical protein ACOZIN_04235 [Myxococcota bacterium]
MSPRPFLLWFTLSLLAAGCNRYSRRVPDDVLKRLPYESRIELLEAENELALAIDHLDEAKAEVSRTRDGLRRAKDRLGAAKNEVGEAEDDVSRDVAELAVLEAESRVAFLRARQVVNVKKEAIQELALRCAHARFEVARVNVARKAKVEGAEGLSTEEFESQAKSCEEAVAEKKTALKEELEEEKAAKSTWDKDKRELAKKTFDARASPYVE